jgi:hypothetical protein
MDITKQIDNTTHVDFLTCPRKGFFRHIMHLVPDGGRSKDLVFGAAWHAGMETALNNIKNGNITSSTHPSTAAEISMLGFFDCWEKEGGSEFNLEQIFPKTPARAHDMYNAFWSQYLEEFLRYEIMGAELKFSLELPPLDGQPFPVIYIGKLDGVVFDHDDDILTILEHKTTKYFNDTWLAGFENNLQIEGYLAAGMIYYDRLPRVEIIGALCQKTKGPEFHRHPITRRDAAIDRFLYEVRANVMMFHMWLDAIELFKQAHPNWQTDRNIPFLPFPRHPGTACTLYFRRCAYFDICLARNNPLTFTEPPTGYKIEEWDPFPEENNVQE